MHYSECATLKDARLVLNVLLLTHDVLTNCCTDAYCCHYNNNRWNGLGCGLLIVFMGVGWMGWGGWGEHLVQGSSEGNPPAE